MGASSKTLHDALPAIEGETERILVVTDRELDRLCAEKVMGLKIIRATKKKSVLLTGCRVCYGWYVDTGKRHMFGPIAEDILRYTTDPTAWMQVVEKMIERGWKFELCHGQFMAKWRAAFYKGNHLEMLEPEATVGRAVCLAALKAVEGQDV